MIGGNAVNTGNVISGNTTDGIDTTGSTSTGNIVQGNFIGTDSTTQAALGNLGSAIVISGAIGQYHRRTTTLERITSATVEAAAATSMVLTCTACAHQRQAATRSTSSSWDRRSWRRH